MENSISFNSAILFPGNNLLRILPDTSWLQLSANMFDQTWWQKFLDKCHAYHMQVLTNWYPINTNYLC